MTDEETLYAHGDSREVLGVDCRFVHAPHAHELEQYLRDTQAPAMVGCRACPADQKPACNNTPCFGGYWVPVDVFNILRLRGMPGGSDT